MANEFKRWIGPPPFLMNTADVQEELGKVPNELKVEKYEKIILAITDYHFSCHQSRLIMADKIDMIIRSED